MKYKVQLIIYAIKSKRPKHLDMYSNLPNNRAGWNKRAGWTFFKVYCTFIRQAIVKKSKKGPNKDVQGGLFPKKNKVCCTIIGQGRVHIRCDPNCCHNADAYETKCSINMLA